MMPPATDSSPAKTTSNFPWVGIAIAAIIIPAALTLLWHSSETARELLAKSLMTLAGWLATPFILESSAAITGFIIVLTYNEWRRRQDGPEWVEMQVDAPVAQKTPQGEEAQGRTSR